MKQVSDEEWKDQVEKSIKKMHEDIDDLFHEVFTLKQKIQITEENCKKKRWWNK